MELSPKGRVIKIFISYRREDSAYPAQRIQQELLKKFGEDSVIYDVDSIPLGIDFRDYLEQEIGSCEILLAVIGSEWLDILTNRATDTEDFVRIELEVALARGIPVVPVLVDKAELPEEKELPKTLASLAYRNAAELRAGKDMDAHMNRLIESLAMIGASDKITEKGHEIEEQSRSSWGVAIISLGAVFTLVAPWLPWVRISGLLADGRSYKSMVDGLDMLHGLLGLALGAICCILGLFTARKIITGKVAGLVFILIGIVALGLSVDASMRKRQQIYEQFKLSGLDLKKTRVGDQGGLILYGGGGVLLLLGGCIVLMQARKIHRENLLIRLLCALRGSSLMERNLGTIWLPLWLGNKC